MILLLNPQNYKLKIINKIIANYEVFYCIKHVHKNDKHTLHNIVLGTRYMFVSFNDGIKRVPISWLKKIGQYYIIYIIHVYD